MAFESLRVLLSNGRVHLSIRFRKIIFFLYYKCTRFYFLITYGVCTKRIVYFDTRGENGRLAHLQWANCPCGLMCRTIFFFTNSCEPELAHRLQTSKMRRNWTSLDSCQHDDINILTVSVARRRWTAPLKLRRPCIKHFTTFYALLKHVSPKGDYFTPKGHFFAP